MGALGFVCADKNLPSIKLAEPASPAAVVVCRKRRLGIEDIAVFLRSLAWVAWVSSDPTQFWPGAASEEISLRKRLLAAPSLHLVRLRTSGRRQNAGIVTLFYG
jgi:hypothetical protein